MPDYNGYGTGPRRSCQYAIAHETNQGVRYISHHTTETSAINVATRWKSFLSLVPGENLRSALEQLFETWGVYDLGEQRWIAKGLNLKRTEQPEE